MNPALEQAARAYRLAAAAAAQHAEAATLAADMVEPLRQQLAALDPSHPLLQLQPADLASLHLTHPLQLLVELFFAPPNRQWPLIQPQTALLAGSLAILKAGPGTPAELDVLRRVHSLTRHLLSLQR